LRSAGESPIRDFGFSSFGLPSDFSLSDFEFNSHLISTITMPKMEPSIPSNQPAFRQWIGCLILFLITAIGGFLRFYRLTYPPLWNDETLVYWRVCGTYGQLLNVLRSHDAFPPLHYSLYWFIGRFFRLTPLVMRLPPAICGTLNIPAVYLLARQLLPRKTSLVAAALTACSAFMLFYSRDAKMYPEFYLLATLNVACLWRWFRTHALTDWLCWVAAGCGMVGFYSAGLIVPAFSLVFLLTQSKFHWHKTLWYLAGIALIGSGPLVYYTKFDTVMDRVADKGWGEGTGTAWVGPWYNGDRTGPEHALLATSAFLIGYEWPKHDYVGDDPEKAIAPISAPLVECPELAVKEILWLLAIALLPWATWLGRASAAEPEPPWRIVLWLGVWIGLVGYAFYCQSVRGFVSPRRWDYELRQCLGPYGIALLIGAMATHALIALRNPATRAALLRSIQVLAAVAVLYGGCWAIYKIYFRVAVDAEFSGNPLPSLWEPRYLGFIWPAVALTVAALLMRLPSRPVRIACIAFVLAVNLAMAGLRLAINTEPPIDRLAGDIAAAQDPRSPVRTYDFIARGDIGTAGAMMNPDPQMAAGRYFLEVETNHQPMSPDLFVASYYDFNYRSNPSLGWFRRSISNTPLPQKIVVWSQIMPWQMDGARTPIKLDSQDKILLANGWRLTDEQIYTVRIYWDWRERWKWVRREFVTRNAE
jgi:4-amino-4-deoxy-L-arabinose transferase-like glycosyltransferase